MLHLTRWALAVSAVAAMTLCMTSDSFAAGKSCVTKSAEGTGGTEKAAQFQVDEALLQAVDWGAWASWMSNGSPPGYSYGKRSYKCKGGSGLGYTCRGTSTICKI